MKPLNSSISLLLFICAICGFILSSLAAEPPYTDPFTSAEHANRRPTRGPWVIEGGVASCKQDDALYKQFKDHGPVTWFDLDFTDATVAFAMKPDAAVKSFVFTINGADGHIFRFVTSARPTLIKAFAREGIDDPEEVLDREGPALKPGEWTNVTVKLEGEKAVVKIGDYEKTVKHPAIAQPKTTIGLGFAFGTMEFKEFSVK